MKKDIIKEIELFKNIHKLKFVYRYTWRTFDWQLESTWAHTWSMNLLTDYLLEKLEEKAPWKYKLDKLKIYELIAYHDLLEAETWDVDYDKKYSKDLNKEELEKKAFPIFLEKLPESLKNIYEKNLEEYKKRETLESKFVKLVDVTEAEFQCFTYKDIWQNWTREEYDAGRWMYHDYFPEIKYIYEEMLDELEKNWYFKK